MAVGRFNSYQAQVLVILALVNFVNYIDRQIIFPLFSLIKADFALSDFQLGLLGTVFSIVHALGTLPLGWLADRTSRVKVISYGVLFWSGATFLSGLAGSFRSLLAARALVGVGEAAYTPAAAATLSDSFPQAIRARVQGVFNLGMFVGGALGLALGGIIAEWAGWRPAFFLVGVPGLVLALTVLRLPEPPREKEAERVPLLLLLRVPAYVLVLVSGWLVTFAGYAYISWGTEFVVRYKGFGLREAGVSLGVLLVAAGIFGVLGGAALADRLAQRFVWGRVLAVSGGFLLSAPLLYWALHAPSKGVFLGAFFAGAFFMTWYHGPVTAILHDLTPPRAHATAMGLYLFVVHLFATTLAPAVIGRIADRAGLLAGMHTALAAQVAGGLLFLLVIYFIRRDGLRHPALAAYR